MARETFPEQPAETKTNDKNQTAQLRLLLREVGMIVRHDLQAAAGTIQSQVAKIYIIVSVSLSLVLLLLHELPL